jgi:23S rRNA pseudouridine1911/1915/1917 synthase
MPDPNIRFTVLFEDECLIVVDKPAGITVHPGTIGENATLVHGLLARFPDLQTSFAHEDDRRPGIVHRLDRGTSGVMVVARTPAARLALMAQFAHRDVEKTYLAWVLGAPPERGDWQSPIARHPRDRRRFAVSAKGKPAITHFVRERCRDGASRLRIQLETGRTHQIRVHASHAGFPLLGDPVYRRRVPVPADLTDWLPHRDRPALHSLSVRFRHPLDGREIFVESPLPDDLIDLDRRFV